MASSFQSPWLASSITLITKNKNGAAVGSGSDSVFATINGLKPGRSLKLRREISTGYSLVADKDWRIHCGYVQGKHEHEQEPPCGATTDVKQVVEKFYNSINNKNESQLAALLSEDCCYEDALFDSPLKGKKDVSRFAARLMDAMGPNVKFEAHITSHPEELYEASARWILNWKNRDIPFTMGFNMFTLKLHEKELLISNIETVNEEPRVKPGERILKLLKFISTTLDESQSDIEAISISLPKIYRIMKEDSSLADIAELVAEPFKLNNDGNSPTKLL